MNARITFGCLLLAILLFASTTSAPGHVPRVGGEGTIRIEDPSVSQVYYRILQADQTHTYKLSFTDTGDVIVGLNSPNPNPAPPIVRIETNKGTTILRGSTKSPEYEPFAPDVYYPVGRIKKTVSPGTYTVTVNGEGRYALIVGQAESFSLQNWIRTGLEIPRTRLWSGRWWILLPGVLPLVLFFWWFREQKSITGWLAGASGALCITSGITTISAFVWAVTIVPVGWGSLIALIQVVLQTGIGSLLLYQSTKITRRFRWRIGIATLSILAALTWAGVIVGPMLGVVASVIPEKRLESGE
jgi:hypothetical protein